MWDSLELNIAIPEEGDGGQRRAETLPKAWQCGRVCHDRPHGGSVAQGPEPQGLAQACYRPWARRTAWSRVLPSALGHRGWTSSRVGTGEGRAASPPPTRCQENPSRDDHRCSQTRWPSVPYGQPQKVGRSPTLLSASWQNRTQRRITVLVNQRTTRTRIRL